MIDFGVAIYDSSIINLMYSLASQVSLNHVNANNKVCERFLNKFITIKGYAFTRAKPTIQILTNSYLIENSFSLLDGVRNYANQICQMHNGLGGIYAEIFKE